jgi:hypothetical protein
MSIRLVFNGGDNMLGRAVALSCAHRTLGNGNIIDSMPASYYLKLSLHPSDSDTDVPIETIRRMNSNHGSYLWGDLPSITMNPAPDLRVLNLETAIADSIEAPDLSKGITYHMNVACMRSCLLPLTVVDLSAQGRIMRWVLSNETRQRPGYFVCALNLKQSRS